MVWILWGLINVCLCEEMREPPYFIGYGRTRLLVHSLVTGKWFDIIIAAVIGLNVITMSLEHYLMPVVGCWACWDVMTIELRPFSFQTGTGLRTQGVQLCLLQRLHRRGDHEGHRSRPASLPQGQVEPAGRGHCVALHSGHHTGGDGIHPPAHQSHHHPRDACGQDSASAQTAQNGQRNPSAVGHGHASTASGGQSGTALLLALLHIRRSGHGTVWTFG